jgi:PAS domain S-box-containing protein
MFKSIKSKITSVYLCLVIMIAFIGTVSVINLYNLSGAIDNLMTENYKSINALNNMLEAAERQDSAVLIYINFDKQKGIDMFSDNNNIFTKWYDIENNNITEPGEGKLVQNTNMYYTKYTKSFLQLQEIRNSKGLQPALDFYDSTITMDFVNLKQEMKALSVLNEKAMFNRKNEATEKAKHSMNTILVLTTIAIIGGFLTALFSTNRFLKPIFSLTQTIKLVKAGDLNQQAKIITKDEIGELAQEFNSMTKRLQQYEQSTLGKLLAEKNKSLAIVNSISDPLVVLDTDYRVVMLNKAFEKFFSVSEDDLTNRHFLEGIRNGEIFDFISKTFMSKEGTTQKIFLIRSNNEDYYFNVILAMVNDNNANLSGTIVVFQNVTQLKELEKTRTDFIATISHEFKTPLTSIMMGTDVLMDEGMGVLNDDQKQFIKAIHEDGDRLAKLVNDLLELTLIESGKAIFKLKQYAIDDIIDFAVKPFYQLAEQHNVSLYFQCEDNLPPVIADFEKITWVLNNLISNALKYTNAGDEICVSASTKEHKVYVTVKDTGMGIPEEYLDKIFEKFVQVKDGDLEIRGTGLGLYVVKGIIKAHNGGIWCESKLDIGSSFTFTLNIAGKES